MAKLSDQSFDYDLPLIKLARDWTVQADLNVSDPPRITWGDYQASMCSCLIDNSVMSWFASGPGNDNGKERRAGDLAAFEDLVRLAGIGKITMSIPKSVLEEIQKAKFADEVKEKVNDICRRARLKYQTDSIRSVVGQRTYGSFQDGFTTGDEGLDELLKELFEPEADPSVPAEDREHYLMACLGQQPFVTMDYRLVGKIASAIAKQVELIEGKVKGKSIPKQRPPLKAPVVTPSAYLNQVLLNQPTWKRQLELARTEPDSRVCYDLRQQYAAIGQQLAEPIQSDNGSAEERRSLEVEWARLEKQLHDNRCNLDFFENWPEELRPERWKQIEQPGQQRTEQP